MRLRIATPSRRAGILGALALATTAATVVVAGTAPAQAARSDECRDRGRSLFCETFEDLPPGEAAGDDWGVDTRDGSLTVVEGQGRDGQVLAVHTEGNGHAFLEVEDFTAPRNSFYGRMWVRVEAFPTAPDWAHFTLVETSGEGDGSLVRPIGGQYVDEEFLNDAPSGSFWGVGSDGGPTGDWTDWRESVPAESGRWTCLEWQQDARDNRVRVWIDGAPQHDLTVTTTQHGGNQVDFVFPRFDTVRIGWQLYQADPTPSSYDLQIDDVALATKRLGCRS
ncbi:hypothetical protein ACTWP5_13455 [Streptomyces sp. 4N509B]|uniref:hypothetical protein n=1 Tax=Streptomyces sp. 4N509B TaxID=3457413 RepID=UPI003FD399BE